jgi:hypothetical protein
MPDEPTLRELLKGLAGRQPGGHGHDHTSGQEPQRGVPGRTLLRFAGTIPVADALAMEQAVDEGCEKVDRTW